MDMEGMVKVSKKLTMKLAKGARKAILLEVEVMQLKMRKNYPQRKYQINCQYYL